MNVSRNRKYARARRGAILSEALVSAAILLAGIGIVARSHSNLRRLWGDTRHFQLATDELCNQLDRLTLMPKDQLEDSLRQLQVSPEIAAVLPECRIAGTLIEDPLGSRLQLKIDWKRVGTGKPLELTGWLQSTDQPTVDQSASDASKPTTSDSSGKESQ
jgi:hypothetical protein